jgi:hypothetical protein
MKIFLKQIFAFVCAGYFLVALSGYNIVRYCCDSCANAGIAMVVGKSCHTIHHESKYIATSCAKSAENQCEETDINCNILRVQTDIPSLAVTSASHHQDSDLSVEFPNTTLNFQNKYKFQTEQFVHYPPNKKVLLLSGRDILTRNAVLLI